MASVAPMFLELEREERERQLDQEEQERKEQLDAEFKNRLELSDNPTKTQSVRAEDYQQKGKRLLLAAEKGDLFKLIRNLHQNPELINYSDSDGYTPLHRACYGGHLDCVKYLLRHGANIEAKTNDRWTPLHCAARWNNVDVTEYLVRSGADVNARSSGNNTPLHIVASNGRYSITMDIIQLLLFHPECDPTVKNDSGDTAFDIAKRSGPFYKLWVGVATLTLEEANVVDEETILSQK